MPTACVSSPTLCPATFAGLHVRSRLVLPPMASQTADTRGFVTSRTLDHYARLVGERHGIAYVEYSHVHHLGRSEPNQTGIDSDAHVPGMAQLARQIRSSGAVAGLQLAHAGGKTHAELLGGATPRGASALTIPAHPDTLPAPQAMTRAEIEELVAAYVGAANRAVAAGFQVIEVHAAHGYLLNQWLSPLTNQRTDQHGGSLANRARVPLRIVSEVRDAIGPEVPLTMRFAAQDRLDGGLTLQDGVWLARRFAEAGVDAFNVSSGLGGWRRQRGERGEGYLVTDAAAIRAATGLPVIGVGGIETLEYSDDAIERGDVDFVAVGRAMLANPAWPDADPVTPKAAAPAGPQPRTP